MLILSALGLSFLTTKTFLGELSFVSFLFAVQIKRVRLYYFCSTFTPTVRPICPKILEELCQLRIKPMIYS